MFFLAERSLSAQRVRAQCTRHRCLGKLSLELSLELTTLNSLAQDSLARSLGLDQLLNKPMDKPRQLWSTAVQAESLSGLSVSSLRVAHQSGCFRTSCFLRLVP